MGTAKFDAQEGRTARTLALRGRGGAEPAVRSVAEARKGAGRPGSAAPVGEAASQSDRVAGTIARQMARGERLAAPADVTDPVSIVQSGAVALFRALPGNRSICVGILGPGDIVLHQTGPEHDAVMIEAMTDAVILQEGFARLVTVLSGSPQLVQAALSSLRRQTTEMQDLVSRVLSRDIALRLAAALLSLAERFGRPSADGTLAIGIPIAHKTLARMIGSNRVTVTRVMTEMREQGMVQAPGRNQVVVDVALLRAYLAGNAAQLSHVDE